ncbi:M20 metallopeptidase family protein [Gemmatimonas phototrophica]|uniref:N-acyl-L-amino acid amidohydrolase n=1 Tax=Gemmatimonas phototrophica TaxID=1379270 RepID=A0A143BLG3_9BACT|nr:amidohydrolase [Gemmatimonas phototrophica]AMW05848.1 N-acyl-L-amino acid amidohydrolase [Gemmatimonas phototrophica]
MKRLLLAGLLVAAPLRAQQGPASPALLAEIDKRTAAIVDKVTAWRHDIHQHPELGYQEKRTAALVAAHLKSLGMEVQENVGGIPGVVGILKGGKPGPTVALRADMDALPVTELVNVPFKSTVRTVYNGVETGVMHACGHDMHTAMLMGTAEVLAGLKASLPGTVKFLFQPAEEVPPRGGAQPMIDAGVMQGVDGVFGLHVGPGPLGALSFRQGAISAASDGFRIVVHGKQSHGAAPSRGVDPIVVSAEIVTALQTIVSRSVDLGAAPAVVTVGAIHGGLRENIIPDSVWMIGTIRTFDPAARTLIGQRMKTLATNIAAAHNATAEVTVDLGYGSTINHAAMVSRFSPTLKRVAGTAGAQESKTASMAGEDFSRFAELAPGFFFNLAVSPVGTDLKTVASNHSPLFQGDDKALPVGVRAMSTLALEFLTSGGIPRVP